MLKTEKKDIGKWFIFPDLLPSLRFLGFATRDDISQIRGLFPVGQNVFFTDGMTPTPRDGSQLIGVEATSVSPVKRAWVFERRDGVQIEMKTYGTGVYYRIDGVMTDFKLLKGGFTDGLEFAYGVLSQTALTTSFLQFCNGTDAINRWTGVYGLYASDDGVNIITLSGSSDLSDLGFTATGTIIINGVEITYTGLTGKTLTGCSAVPSSPTVGDVVAQSPITTGFTSTFVYSVGLVHDGRIHTRSEAKKSVSYYSKLDDPFNWTVGSTDGDGGGKEIEQGGPITAYAHDETKLYIFKKRLIKTLEFVQGSTRVDVPKYGTLKPSDDKSLTVGALGQKSTFHSPNGIIFITEDKQLLHLTRESTIDYPQTINISDQLRPTFKEGVHGDASGIVFKGKVFYAYKQDSNSSFNDTVLVYDLVRKIWYTPIIGWNVSDWTIVDGKLHWHSSINSNSYEVIDEKLDETLGFTTIIRSWAENFGNPELQKNIGYLFLEIYMQENSELTATILYDEDGYSGKDEITLNADTDSNNKFNSAVYNTFGVNPFGYERFGSNADLSGLKKYRYLVELKGNIDFFNVSLQLSGNKDGDDWEMIRFGYYLNSIFQNNSKKYLKAI